MSLLLGFLTVSKNKRTRKLEATQIIYVVDVKYLMSHQCIREAICLIIRIALVILSN
jgi:hypothetical protein